MKKLMSKFLDKTFLRFIIVGVINTVFGAAVMFVFYNIFHLSYWISSASNYFFGSILSYFLNKHFTFRYKERGFGVVFRFILNISACYLAAYGIAKPLFRWMLSGFSAAVQENVAMLGGMCLFVMFNYIGQRFFAFRKKEN